MDEKFVGQGITFDDVLLVPAFSEIVPKDCDVRSRFSRNIPIDIPLASAAMDTVTESRLAIALAQHGGIGVIHYNLSIAEQALEVEKVKRSANGIIEDPICLRPDATIGEARTIMRQHNIGGIPITGDGGRLTGILTNRDLRFHEEDDTPVAEVMTSEGLVTGSPSTTLEDAKKILHKNKIEKLLLVNDSNELVGLITIRDINKLEQFPEAARDTRGRLRVAAAVAVFDYERTEALIEAGVDAVAIDSAHGHSKNVVETIKEIKKNYEIDAVAGNVATYEGAKALADAGADGIKAGIGPGAICTTRVIAGVGVPQITAIMETARAIKGSGVPLIADGGIRHSGDLTKALAAGADCCMLGSLFAGLEESPGELVIYKGRTFKAFRGMGSIGAMVKGKAAERYGQADGRRAMKLVPEGVESRVPYRGQLDNFVYQLVGGIRAGMGYCGASDISGLKEKGRFVRISAAALAESHPHDVVITREAPNYSLTYGPEDDQP